MEQYMKKISIIVAVYNIESYIERCINSILAQTYKNYEVILVDDGSTDRSSILCDFYEQQDNRISVVHKKNEGLVSARKTGLMHAQGDYVSFIDGDDWIEPHMYEHLISLAAEYQADMVLGGSLEDVDGQTVNKMNQIKLGVFDKERLRKEVYPYMLCMGTFFSMGIQPYLWNKLIRRELAYKCVMYVDDRIRIGEDVAAVMPMIWKANKVVISDYCDYHYCIRSASMMRQKENEENEWNELCILHRFLRHTFSAYQNQCGIDDQINYYTVMNMLTRTYEKVAAREGKRRLWPFHYQMGTGKYIVYGAGNFGRTVYNYLKAQCQDEVKWVDRDYQRYRLMALPVCKVEEIVKEQDTNILVAVLDMRLSGLIKEDLLQLGVHREQVHCINVSDDEVRAVLDNACLL